MCSDTIIQRDKIIYDSLFSIQGLSPVELYRTVENGFTCHFNNSEACSNISTHGWIFLIAYIVFSISALNFLSMCESAVFTVAAATVSLPLSGIWWSIYKMDVHGGKWHLTIYVNYYCYFLSSMCNWFLFSNKNNKIWCFLRKEFEFSNEKFQQVSSHGLLEWRENWSVHC